MKQNTSFTKGKILQPLILFAFPVLLALFLQAMYGAVDLLVVGKFATSADVSAQVVSVIASAGVGVAEKVCAFIMPISSAFMQSMSAFVAQNYGAGHSRRILCQSSGFLFHEHSAGHITVSHRTGNADIIYSAVDPLRQFYADITEKRDPGRPKLISF